MFGNKLRRKGSDNGSSALPERVPEGPGRRDKHYRNSNNQLIECRRLVKTYHSPAGDFPALKEIDLQVDAGEFVAVIGKSGSAKSTLVNVITGIDRPTGGEVLVGDTCREQGKKLMVDMKRWPPATLTPMRSTSTRWSIFLKTESRPVNDTPTSVRDAAADQRFRIWPMICRVSCHCLRCNCSYP